MQTLERTLFRRWPRLAQTLPHVDLGVTQTAIDAWLHDDATINVKRDDRSTPTLGGNKARALELLLAGVQPGDTLLTVGSTGSTHALAVAHFGARLGATTRVITWPQEEHDISRATAARLRALASVTAASSPVAAMARAALLRLTSRVRWIPAGGSSPLGTLGHAAAALELTDWDTTGGYAFDTIVVPLGTGGTAAGLLVGLALAGLPIRVLGVRVVPRVVANRGRVLRLARRTARLFGKLAGVAPPQIDETRFTIDGEHYGGAYARELDAARELAAFVKSGGGPVLDGTYSAKALAAALSHARRAPAEHVLFWLTFDGRWLSARDDAGEAANGGETR
ncbi:MAG TPA: pyridoxal-phosphate dependent enzyme [Gemmatimonadaceae bacterium]|nr:pyridoxal-phosphate dependent enzyme [Gemmatimonadaceae bacterium]